MTTLDHNSKTLMQFWTFFPTVLEALKESSTQEIIFSGPESFYVAATHSYSKKIPQTLNLSDYQKLLEDLAVEHHQNWNFTSPYASFGSTSQQIPLRITIVHFSITARKISQIFIRRLSSLNLLKDPFVIDEKGFYFVKELVKKRENILISGSTCSGKTTLLQSLSHSISLHEHVLILEDTLELNLSHLFNTHLIAENAVNKKLADLCVYAMRMRPDRIILGEIRSLEIIPLLMLINSGHRGLLTTIHAINAQEALSRMALLFSLFSGNQTSSFNEGLHLVCKNIQYVVHLENKRIHQIVKVIGSHQYQSYVEEIFLNAS